mmetsp:Transcript_57899/g.137804  ORF Transcript_57899/g.137804 Transcript_57899/m.137804 type:complete len:350 (+) Transcript_57899:666-1715(+)
MAEKRARKLRRSRSVSSVVIPASSIVIDTTGSPPGEILTRMFPGWRSPWMKLWRKHMWRKERTPMRASSLLVSVSSDRGPLIHSARGTPSWNVSTSTAFDTSGRIGRGKERSFQEAKSDANRSRFSASSRRSNWLPMRVENSSTLSLRDSQRSIGTRSTTSPSERRRSTSRRVSSRTPGWRSLMATFCSPLSGVEITARCTCAMQPLPTGVSSIDTSVPALPANTSSRFALEADSWWVRAPDCRSENLKHSSAGNMSVRVAVHCANLISAGPELSIAPRNQRHHASSAPPPQTAAGMYSHTSGRNTNTCRASRMLAFQSRSRRGPDGGGRLYLGMLLDSISEDGGGWSR